MLVDLKVLEDHLEAIAWNWGTEEIQRVPGGRRRRLATEPMLIFVSALEDF